MLANGQMVITLVFIIFSSFPRFLRVMNSQKISIFLSIIAISASISACSVGGMIYDDVFSTKTQEAMDGPRRKLNQPAPSPQMSAQTMPYSGSGGMMPPALSTGGLPPVQYGMPEAPVYNPLGTPPINGGSTDNSWGGMPAPSYTQPYSQQNNPAFAAYAAGMASMQQQPPQQPMMQPMLQQPPQQIPQMQASVMQPPINTSMLPMQVTPPVAQALPVPSEQVGFATPNLPPVTNMPSSTAPGGQQLSIGQAVVGLQAPNYVTPITDIPSQQPPLQPIASASPTPAPIMMMQPPLQTQQQIPYQQQAIQQPPFAPIAGGMPQIPQQMAPQQPAQQRPEKDDEYQKKPISSLEGPSEDPIDKLLSPLGEDNLVDKAPTPSSMDNYGNYAQPPPGLNPDNYPEDLEGEAQTYEVPIEKVEIENIQPSPENSKAQAASEEIDEILKSSNRSAYTPASQLIDKMQVRGKPASMSSVKSNKDSLNTPLGFDAYGDPVIPDASNQTQNLNQIQPQNANTQNIREVPNSASKNIGTTTTPPSPINSLQQRMNDMRL